MIPILVAVFLFLIFLVAIIMSARTWRGWHIATICLTFISCMVLVVCAALSVKTHVVWRKLHADMEKDLQVSKQEGEVLAYGDPDLVESAQPSLVDTKERLYELLLDRGRIWRNCTPSAPQNKSIVISTVPPDLPQDQVKPNGINVNTVLYAFKELPVQEGGMKVPAVYLGEFKVLKADPQSVTLQNTMPLQQNQAKHIADRSATWALYEMMPIDTHRIFSDQNTIGRPLDDTDKPVFGEMNEQTLRKVFSLVTGFPPEDPRVGNMISVYVQDGRPATDQQQSESPENIWLKLEFEKPFKERVDSNNIDPGISGDFFDPEGYAEVSQLRRDSDVEIKINDIGIFPYGYEEDKQAVDGLISKGICKMLKPFFVRDLRDYESAFHEIQMNMDKRAEDIRRAKRDIAALQQTIRGTQQQLAYRQDERVKLQADRDHFNEDLKQITQLAEQLAAQKKSLQQDLSQLFQTNLALSQQLTAMDQKLTEEINRRTAEATAAIP